MNCAICSTECLMTCSSLAGIPLNHGIPDLHPVPTIPTYQNSLIPVASQINTSPQQCNCPPPVCVCVPLIGSSYTSCNCEYSNPCSCSAKQQFHQCQPQCQEVCQRNCFNNCTLCASICVATCSSLSSDKNSERLSQNLEITTTAVPVINLFSPAVPQTPPNSNHCTCPLLNCVCLPTLRSGQLPCSCEYSVPCICTPEEQLQQCQLKCQEVCQRSCNKDCAICGYACFTTCSALSSQTIPNSSLTTVSTRSLPVSPTTTTDPTTSIQPKQSYFTILPVPRNVQNLSSTTGVPQVSKQNHCVCPAPNCVCVPTIGVAYLTCNCHYSNPCGCSTEEQMQQCQPVCQEVCRRSCAVNCAVCNYSCSLTCSTLPETEAVKVPQIQLPVAAPLNSLASSVPYIPADLDRCSCPPPKCVCVPSIASMYLSCNCKYSNPCSCGPEQQFYQCQPACQDVCQNTCTINCAACANVCFTSCTSLSGSQVIRFKRNQLSYPAPYKSTWRDFLHTDSGLITLY